MGVTVCQASARSVALEHVEQVAQVVAIPVVMLHHHAHRVVVQDVNQVMHD